MASRTEERLRDLLRDYLHDREEALQSRVHSSYTSILLWGILIGIILSYTSLVPLCIGVVVGYSLAKNDNWFLPLKHSVFVRNMMVVLGYNY